jgi:hypothetical protein
MWFHEGNPKELLFLRTANKYSLYNIGLREAGRTQQPAGLALPYSHNINIQ